LTLTLVAGLPPTGERFKRSENLVEWAVSYRSKISEEIQGYGGNKMSSDYPKEFQYVKETFFPTWDKQGLWRLELAEDLNGATAYCKTEPKTIEVLKSVGFDKLRVILIHEISHAVTSCGHGKPWLSRMEKAAQKAERLGMNDLAQQIRSGLDWYGEAPHYRQVIYTQIVDAVISQPDADFMTLISVVGREYGISGEELLESCKRARKVYDQAKKEALEHRRIREELLKLAR
jgi:hypothetical protein